MSCTEEKKKETNLFYFSQSLFLNQNLRNVKFTRNAFSKRFESEETQKAIERKWISVVSSGATANFWHLDPACIVNHQLTNIVDPLFSAWLILMSREIPTSRFLQFLATGNASTSAYPAFASETSSSSFFRKYG